jgi:arabinose-5-phosphate isomerase
MAKVMEEMSRKGFGMTHVVESGRRLVGVITDGDLRRWLQKAGSHWAKQTAADCMSRTPTTVHRREIAARALRLMESQRITALPVVNEGGRLEGLLHLHDCSELRRQTLDDRNLNGNLP